MRGGYLTIDLSDLKGNQLPTEGIYKKGIYKKKKNTDKPIYLKLPNWIIKKIEVDNNLLNVGKYVFIQPYFDTSSSDFGYTDASITLPIVWGTSTENINGMDYQFFSYFSYYIEFYKDDSITIGTF